MTNYFKSDGSAWLVLAILVVVIMLLLASMGCATATKTTQDGRCECICTCGEDVCEAECGIILVDEGKEVEITTGGPL